MPAQLLEISFLNLSIRQLETTNNKLGAALPLVACIIKLASLHSRVKFRPAVQVTQEE